MMMDSTNFKEKAQEELIADLPAERASMVAFLSAVAKCNGAIEFQRHRMNLTIAFDTYEKALSVVTLFKKLYPADFELSVDNKNVGKHGISAYSVQAPSGLTKQILLDLYLMTADDDSFTAFCDGVPQTLIGKNSSAVAYLKGLFFAVGSIYVPSLSGNEKKDGYHFEFQFDDEFEAESVQHFLLNFDIASKINERGSHFLVYIKDKDEILKLLGIMELAESSLQLQSIINERETANSLNRTIICETANLDKTYTASSKQLWAIGVIDERDGLDSLTPPLKSVALTRMENGQATLIELAEILGVSKSCVNHRLRRLVEIAEDTEKKE
ncbi:MAG: DNA-binding protein WhiA [Clostridia bacterium]